MKKEFNLSEKIGELKADDLANWYKEHERYLESLSSMEICDGNHNCNEFVIKKLKEKILKDVKEAVRLLKEIVDIETIGKVSKTKFKNRILEKINKIFLREFGEKLI